MSQNILIGKSRKTGEWELIVNPNENYDVHLRAYQKIASAFPINDEFSRVLLGRIQNVSSPLTLVTTDEQKERENMLKDVQSRATEAGKDADGRQAKIVEREAEDKKEKHESAVDKKNAEINNLRKATGQETFAKTKHEETTEAFQKGLPKIGDKPKVESKPEAEKSHKEQLAEKNALIETVQQQASEIGKAPEEKPKETEVENADKTEAPSRPNKKKK